ncbi:MAG: C40 family peptidase [Coriobacteriia bacterium]|nr:C40 family peptidase [Coriobacteriia bacterium]
MAHNRSHSSKHSRIVLLTGVILLVVAVAVFAVVSLSNPGSRSSVFADIQRVVSGNKPTPPPAPGDPTTDRERLIVSAYSYLGVPYKFGSKAPGLLDCSGFTKLAYAGIGVAIPDGSYNQAQGEKPLTSVDQLQPGDLIFYRFKQGAGVTHVTMYRGDGWIIGTTTPGQAHKVSLYPASDDLTHAGWTLTYRHIVLPDEKK